MLAGEPASQRADPAVHIVICADADARSALGAAIVSVGTHALHQAGGAVAATAEEAEQPSRVDGQQVLVSGRHALARLAPQCPHATRVVHKP